MSEQTIAEIAKLRQRVAILEDALRPFSRLADALDDAARHHLGVSASGLRQDTKLPVGGTAIQDKCRISIEAILNARAHLLSEGHDHDRE